MIFTFSVSKVPFHLFTYSVPKTSKYAGLYIYKDISHKHGLDCLVYSIETGRCIQNILNYGRKYHVM